MRGDALRETWKDYAAYIAAAAQRNKPGREHARAWDECDIIASRVAREGTVPQNYLSNTTVPT